MMLENDFGPLREGLVWGEGERGELMGQHWVGRMASHWASLTAVKRVVLTVLQLVGMLAELSVATMAARMVARLVGLSADWMGVRKADYLVALKVSTRAAH